MTSIAKRPPHPPKDLSDQALAWVVRLHSGEADKADWRAFDDWRGQSRDHEAAAKEAESLWRDASDLHRDPETGMIRPGRGGNGQSRRAVLGGLAGAAFVGAAGLLAARSFRLSRGDYATRTGQTRIVELADGSRVTLNAASAVDVDYGLERRVALLRGQAFFEVAPDHSRPFVAAARGNRIVALGTAFDIDMNLPADGIAVSVTEHAVRIEAGAPQSGTVPDSLVVDEGQRVVISAGGRFGRIAAQDAAVATAWRTGMYVAEGKRLDEVIAAFAGYHDGWIVIRGDRIKALRVNAVLDLKTPDASLNALASGLPITVRHLSKFLTVIAGA